MDISENSELEQPTEDIRAKIATPKEEVQEQTNEAKSENDEATEESSEQTQEDGKQKKFEIPDYVQQKIDRRFKKMTAKHHEELSKYEARIRELETLTKSKSVDDFETLEDYKAWQIENKLEQRFAEKEKAQLKAQQSYIQENQKVQSFNERVKKFSEELPDYTQVVANATHMEDIEQSDIDLLLSHEMGVAVTYKLASDPQEYANWEAMSLEDKKEYLLTEKILRKLNSGNKVSVSKTPAPTPKPSTARGGAPNNSRLSTEDWMAKRLKRK